MIFYYHLKLKLSDFFWNMRLFVFLILSFNSKLSQYLFILKNKGVLVIPNFINEELMKVIKERCNFALDNNSDYTNELIQGSIKLKNLGLKEPFFKKLQHNFFLKIISFIYMFQLKTLYRGALIIYSLTHDGNYKHPAVPGKFSGTMIAGDPHFDDPIHKIKAFIALDKIKIENGPFTSIIGSNYHKKLVKNYINILRKIPNSHVIDKKKLEDIFPNNEIFYGTVNKGDLVIIDTKMIHYASSLKKGVREMLWFYY